LRTNWLRSLDCGTTDLERSHHVTHDLHGPSQRCELGRAVVAASPHQRPSLVPVDGSDLRSECERLLVAAGRQVDVERPTWMGGTSQQGAVPVDDPPPDGVQAGCPVRAKVARFGLWLRMILRDPDLGCESLPGFGRRAAKNVVV
jgi:hypothetical protein